MFGDSIGDPTADEIWALARDRHDGITRTEVSNLFSRNKKAREIDRALQALIDAGRLERATIRDPRQRPHPDRLAPSERAGANRRLTALQQLAEVQTRLLWTCLLWVRGVRELAE